jgi:UDP-N-acetylglucosamine:LPS N-acetylglucosamine transferase
LAGVISTGPGLSVVPMLVLRLLGVKIIFVETYCRFNTRSMTGRLMSKIAHRFLVQNKDQLVLYPNAEYCGRL